MRDLSIKELIILAFKGVEATEKECAETKEILGTMFNKIIEQEKNIQATNGNNSTDTKNTTKESRK